MRSITLVSRSRAVLARRCAPLQGQEGDDDLEIVLHPVLQLAQQHFGLRSALGALGEGIEQALLRLHALQRHAEDVGEGREEERVDLVEVARRRRVDLEHAPDPAVDTQRNVEEARRPHARAAPETAGTRSSSAMSSTMTGVDVRKLRPGGEAWSIVSATCPTMPGFQPTPASISRSAVSGR